MDHLMDIKLKNLVLFQKMFTKQTHLLGPILRATHPMNSHTACHLAAHHWGKQCLRSAFVLFIGSFRKSFRVYASLYLVSAILRGKNVTYFLTKLPVETLRSTVFLAANCFNFMMYFCLSRKIFGGISYWGNLLFTFPACFASILIERKQRRGLLALYLTNLATETGFNMLVSRGLVRSLPNGQVLLFAIASALYGLLFKSKSLDGGLSNLIRLLVGSAEVMEGKKPDRKSRVVTYYGVMTVILNNIATRLDQMFFQHHNRHNRWHNSLLDSIRSLEHRIERFLDSFNKASRCTHPKCHHRYNCFIYSAIGFCQRFLAGFGLQAAIKLLGSIGLLVKKPTLFIKILTKIAKNKENVQLGMFLGCFTLIFRAVSCALRWLTNSHQKIHGLIAGFFAGWSMVFYKSSSIALYLNFKLIEIIWMMGVKNGKLPLVRPFDVILYTISTGFVLWVALYEPHNIRKAYWKFLLKISDNRFSQVNRHILDEFGLKSSTIDKL